RLVHAVVVPALEVEFILVSLSHPGDESLPDPRVAAQLQRVLLLVPAVPVADHVDRPRVGCPDGEVGAAGLGMRAEMLVELQVRAFVEEVEIGVGEASAHGAAVWTAGSERATTIAPACSLC